MPRLLVHVSKYQYFTHFAPLSTAGFGFNSWQLPSGGTGLGTSGSTAFAGFPLTSNTAPDVERFLHGPIVPLQLPASYQWRLSLERTTGQEGTASIAYHGAEGHHLLGNQVYLDANTGVLRRQVTSTQNSSVYHAVQVRYARSWRPNVYGSASYTWSHSIDNGSLDSSSFLIHPGYSLDEVRASSNFDVRQVFTTAFSIRVPPSIRSMSLPDWIMGWSLSGLFRARSGFPIDIANAEFGIGHAFDNVGRPDLVTGVPLWLPDRAAPGGRRLNSGAFTDPHLGERGTLGRNTIYGNGLAQLDASIRREISLSSRLALHIGVNMFNVLNRPAFADPIAYRSNALFGQSTSMQNLMLGFGTPNGGLPAQFQTGGARAAELSLRLSF